MRREKTASSKNGRNFGHYKSQHKLCQQYQDIFASIANIPYHTGCSILQWWQVIAELIMKDLTYHRVHRARLFH